MIAIYPKRSWPQKFGIMHTNDYRHYTYIIYIQITAYFNDLTLISVLN